MKPGIKNQFSNECGYSVIEWILIMLVVAFFMLIGFRVIPLYTENQYIVSGLRDLVKADESLLEMTDAEIFKRMENFYTINYVKTEGAKNIVIERDDNRVVVKIDYEAKTRLFTDQPFIGTVDISVSFTNHLDSNAIRECCKPLKAD